MILLLIWIVMYIVICLGISSYIDKNGPIVIRVVRIKGDVDIMRVKPGELIDEKDECIIHSNDIEE